MRIADAMRRGALCRDSVLGIDSIDYLRLDWFSLAELPIADIRQRFGVRDKSPEAIAAGSTSPWEPGGISEYQLDVGRALAAAEGRAYRSYGAWPASTE